MKELDNNLFNKSLMKKYANERAFQLNVTKHNLIKTHIEKIENGEFKSEVSSYLYFYDFLKYILGYDREENILFDEKEDTGRGKSEFALKSGDKKFMVIELKDQDTDLDKPQNRLGDKRSPVDQAFSYAQHSGDIDWIFVSNFKEFRLYEYSKKSNTCIRFTSEDLLDKEKFSFFMLSFSKRSHIEKKYPSKLLEKTLVIEKKLEENFYKLYHETRLMIMKELEEIQGLNRTESLHYAQIILNRYMFICFAEDMNLLPSQLSIKTIASPIKNKSLRKKSIWYSLNNLFIDIDEGNPERGVFEYNGGLFNEDLEDKIVIRDIVEDDEFFQDTYQGWIFNERPIDIESLVHPYETKINQIYKNLLTISSFDFSSDLDVNILGHIFENSIGDIEELKRDAKGRKKEEGIYYTPDYITDFICKNTIIPYLSKSGKVNTVDGLIGEYWGSEIELLDKKVKEIKILDPACGSGAFLNRAADVLLEIQEEIHKRLYDQDKTLDKHIDSVEKRSQILLKNIYGVDLNEESTEITKLSLFLNIFKKAKNPVKLPKIDTNIKCGNSLIDDSDYTDKPFNWDTNFADIRKEGGFDLVIGNPPYITPSLGKKQKPLTDAEIEYLDNNYESYEYKGNTFVVFMEKGIELLKDKGILGFITPNTLLTNYYFKKTRNILLSSTNIMFLINIHGKVFEDAETGGNLITIFEKTSGNNVNNTLKVAQVQNPVKIKSTEFIEIEQTLFSQIPDDKFLLDKTVLNLILKIKNMCERLDTVARFYNGIKTGDNKKFLSKTKETPVYKKVLRGRDIFRYHINFNENYVLFDKEKLWSNTNEDNFKVKEKIIVRQTSDRLIGAYDNNQYFTLDTTHLIIPQTIDAKYLLALVNSKLMNFYYSVLVPEIGKTFAEVKIVNLKQLPICPSTPEQETQIIEMVNQRIELTEELQKEVNGFKHWLKKTFKVERLSKKLENYYELTEDEFFNELKRKGVDTRSRRNREHLEEEFKESLVIINPLLHKIEQVDNEINNVIYELYNLTQEEIKVIENAIIN